MTSEDVTKLVESLRDWRVDSDPMHRTFKVQQLCDKAAAALTTLSATIEELRAERDAHKKARDWLKEDRDNLNEDSFADNKRIYELKSALEAVESQLTELREALRPFADAAVRLRMLDEWRHDEQPAFYTSIGGFDAAAPITVADFRRARAAIRSRTTGDVDETP